MAPIRSASYRPEATLLQRLQKVPLIGVVGITGSGKTTLMRHACDRYPALHMVVSDISRAPREGETHGIDYFFQDAAAMRAKADLHRYATFVPSITGDLYATDPQEYLEYGRPIMAILASSMPNFKTIFPAMQIIAVIPPSFEVWRARSNMHRFTPAHMQKRIAEARESLQFVLGDSDTQFMINDDLAIAQNTFIGLIAGSKQASVHEQADARQIAGEILRHISD